MSDFAHVELGEVLQVKYGKDHKKLEEGTIPCYGTGGIMRYVENSLSEDESILLPRKGSLNNIYYVNEPFWTVDTLFWSIIDKKKALPKYLFYVLSKVDLESLNVGSAVPSLTVPVLNDLRINLPPLPEQKAIAHILGTLDDKIELNRQMNQTLEAMAQALFKSWFVDFDPVIDNALAAGNQIPEALQARAEKRKALTKSPPEGGVSAGRGGRLLDTNPALAALFPSSFEYNETLDKWIPEGWQVKSLYDSADFVNGASFKSEFFVGKDHGIPIIKIAELKNGLSDQTKYTIQEMPEKYHLKEGDLLYSWSGSPETSLNAFLWSGEDGWLNQHVFNVITKNETQKAYIFNLLNHLKPILIAIAKDKQTTGLGHVTVKDMKNLMIPHPGTQFSKYVENGILPLFKKQFNIQLENKTLTNLRDTLLPQLISGKVRLPAEVIAKAGVPASMLSGD